MEIGEWLSQSKMPSPRNRGTARKEDREREEKRDEEKKREKAEVTFPNDYYSPTSYSYSKISLLGGKWLTRKVLHIQITKEIN